MLTETRDGLTRKIEWVAAYDKGEKHGIHGMDLRFLLTGPKGGAQFVIFTNWHLRHVQDRLDARIDREFPHLLCHPQPADIGYHARVPQYEGQEVMADNCHVIGGPCYYDGSSCWAEKVYERFVAEGEDAIWTELQKVYNDIKEN